MAFYVLARSPLTKADAIIQKIVRGNDEECLISLVQGYDGSKNPSRLQRLESIAARESKSKKLIFWLRRTFASLAAHGVEGAQSLLQKLPVVESEN